VILRIEEAVFRDPTQMIHCIAKLGAREIAERYNVPAERLVTLYNGVDTERFQPANRARWRDTKRTELELSGPIALFVGGGYHRKGLDRAIRGLANSHVTANLVVVGGGNKDAAVSLARQLGIEKQVHLLGHRSDPEAWHAAADLLVLPTRYDPFANVVLEGMASGLPVATTAAAGAAELIEHGKNGFVFEDDFSRAFDLLDDLPALEAVGTRARKVAEQYTWSHHTDELIALYEKLRK
jgi:UDP-glucose:(heptosyl)LPS alpha-1,3-glucosyltransferase